jgi:hypothetical protein
MLKKAKTRFPEKRTQACPLKPQQCCSRPVAKKKKRERKKKKTNLQELA